MGRVIHRFGRGGTGEDILVYLLKSVGKRQSLPEIKLNPVYLAEKGVVKGLVTEKKIIYQHRLAIGDGTGHVAFYLHKGVPWNESIILILNKNSGARNIRYRNRGI